MSLKNKNRTIFSILFIAFFLTSICFSQEVKVENDRFAVSLKDAFQTNVYPGQKFEFSFKNLKTKTTSDYVYSGDTFVKNIYLAGKYLWVIGWNVGADNGEYQIALIDCDTRTEVGGLLAPEGVQDYLISPDGKCLIFTNYIWDRTRVDGRGMAGFQPDSPESYVSDVVSIVEVGENDFRVFKINSSGAMPKVELMKPEDRNQLDKDEECSNCILVKSNYLWSKNKIYFLARKYFPTNKKDLYDILTLEELDISNGSEKSKIRFAGILDLNRFQKHKEELLANLNNVEISLKKEGVLNLTLDEMVNGKEKSVDLKELTIQ
jgi:hypothetical protein